MWFVYTLKSKNYQKSYVGCTDNVERRLQEHNSGRSTYTKRYKPWEIIKIEEYMTYIEARNREKFYKSGIGRKKMKEFFKIIKK